MYCYTVYYDKGYRKSFIVEYKRPVCEGQTFRWDGEEWYAEEVYENLNTIYAHKVEY